MKLIKIVLSLVFLIATPGFAYAQNGQQYQCLSDDQFNQACNQWDGSCAVYGSTSLNSCSDACFGESPSECGWIYSHCNNTCGVYTAQTSSGGGSNSGLRDPCPYTNDGDCDEPNGLNYCAWGTDTVDCSNPNSNFGTGSGGGSVGSGGSGGSGGGSNCVFGTC